MKARFLQKIREVLTQNASSHSVAFGGAIGMFFGFLPVFGLKTLLSYFISLALRVNVPVAVIAVTLHDLLLPFLPVILRIEYQMGFWLLSHPHHFAPKINRTHLNLDVFQHWESILRVGGPILLGSVIVGVLSAAATYGFLYGILQQRKRRREVNLSRQQTG